MNPGTEKGVILNIRTPSGLSGDMFLCGLLQMVGEGGAELINLTIEQLGLEHKGIAWQCHQQSVHQIQGWQLSLNLPQEHSHRSFQDIRSLIEKSSLSTQVKESAIAAFFLLAQAEGKVHGKKPENVTFHEVGALDSILDIVLTAQLFHTLAPAESWCSPLPIADGTIFMHHGRMFSPAPAVLEMLQGVPVYGAPAEGETVTPTAIALLKSLGFRFGPWPGIVLQKSAIIYGSKRFRNLPNGAIFAIGSPLEKNNSQMQILVKPGRKNWQGNNSR